MRNVILAVVAVCGFAGPAVAQDVATANTAKFIAEFAANSAATQGTAAQLGRDNANELYRTVHVKWQFGGYQQKMPPMIYMQTAFYIASSLSDEAAGKTNLTNGDAYWTVGVSQYNQGVTAIALGDWALAANKFFGAASSYVSAGTAWGTAVEHYNSACAASLCADALMSQYP